MPDEDPRLVNLRVASAAKQAEAERRAERAIRVARKSGGPVTFRGIAKAAGVSSSFLYANKVLRDQVMRLRATSTSPPRPTTSADARVAVLTNLLDAVREDKRRLHEANEALRRDLAIAHGEILRLRRLTSAGRRSNR